METTLKELIRKYLNEDCSIIKEDSVPENYEFGFIVRYPKIKNKEGKALGNSVSILKPKNKNSIEIGRTITLQKEGLNTFKNWDEPSKTNLVWEIFTFLITQNLLPVIPEDMKIMFRDK